MMKFTDPLCRESGNTLVEAVARFAVAAERNDYAGAGVLGLAAHFTRGPRELIEVEG